MFFRFSLEFGRNKEEAGAEEIDERMPAQVERAPIGFSVYDPWRSNVDTDIVEWEDNASHRRKK